MENYASELIFLQKLNTAQRQSNKIYIPAYEALWTGYYRLTGV